jgi:predicted metal-dependent phosphoesterase TrpH
MDRPLISNAMLSSPIDLHAHTTYSDGSATPAELVFAAAREGAIAIAITDHDTVDGLDEGRIAAGNAGIEFVNGIEMSAQFSPGTMHILGYFIDDRSQALLGAIQRLKEARERRNPEIAARLQRLGYDVTIGEAAAVAGSEVVGRPHFARILLDKGYVESIQEAFDRLLARGSPAYVEKERLSPEEAIALVHSAGGAAVLAHPYQLRLKSPLDVEDKIAELAALGLDGIEAIYSRHNPRQREEYCQLAERQGLLVTGGSDFHGRYKPDIALVRGTGDLNVPHALLDPLRERSRIHADRARTVHNGQPS